MIRKIQSIEDVKLNIIDYFEIERMLPDIDRPRCKTSNIYDHGIFVVKKIKVKKGKEVEVIEDMTDESDIEAGAGRKRMEDYSTSDVLYAQYIGQTWMKLLTKFEYKFLRDFLVSDMDKVNLAYKYGKKYREDTYRWAERLLKRIFKHAKGFCFSAEEAFKLGV